MRHIVSARIAKAILVGITPHNRIIYIPKKAMGAKVFNPLKLPFFYCISLYKLVSPAKLLISYNTSDWSYSPDSASSNTEPL